MASRSWSPDGPPGRPVGQRGIPGGDALPLAALAARAKLCQRVTGPVRDPAASGNQGRRRGEQLAPATGRRPDGAAQYRLAGHPGRTTCGWAGLIRPTSAATVGAPSPCEPHLTAEYHKAGVEHHADAHTGCHLRGQLVEQRAATFLTSRRRPPRPARLRPRAREPVAFRQRPGPPARPPATGTHGGRWVTSCGSGTPVTGRYLISPAAPPPPGPAAPRTAVSPRPTPIHISTKSSAPARRPPRARPWRPGHAVLDR